MWHRRHPAPPPQPSSRRSNTTINDDQQPPKPSNPSNPLPAASSTPRESTEHNEHIEPYVLIVCIKNHAKNKRGLACPVTKTATIRGNPSTAEQKVYLDKEKNYGVAPPRAGNASRDTASQGWRKNNEQIRTEQKIWCNQRRSCVVSHQMRACPYLSPPYPLAHRRPSYCPPSRFAPPVGRNPTLTQRVIWKLTEGYPIMTTQLVSKH
ncbi:hypothetical protein GWI33_014628 [Rhynchophorus ferrugineus]|uniref:Uncharacterized protein n=1 Tax=Rhynchophorus ferrugineus TaxID=354439 RepID=A0A834I4Q3_RHYFE|nr:hypothetical protein GWI33_014628 [Rhynchophorus ferrugineus]